MNTKHFLSYVDCLTYSYALTLSYNIDVFEDKNQINLTLLTVISLSDKFIHDKPKYSRFILTNMYNADNIMYYEMKIMQKLGYNLFLPLTDFINTYMFVTYNMK